MKLLKADMKTFYYASYEENAKIYDDSWHFTGEYGPKYGQIKECKGTFSTNHGTANAQPFGNDIKYDYTIHVPGSSEIDESCRIWYKNSPTKDPDCVVVRVSEARTFTVIAVRKVR